MGEIHSYLSQDTFRSRAQFQNVAIIDTEKFGKMLVLDGDTQSAQHDEYIYHEALVHPALSLHRNPRHVLVIGGGEGATIREVLRHPTVERVIMIDIDGELVEQCKLLLPECTRERLLTRVLSCATRMGFVRAENSIASTSLLSIFAIRMNIPRPSRFTARISIAC